MRVYLDTNILLALMGQGDCELRRDAAVLVMDYSNTLYTSSVCVHELIQLCQIGKTYLAQNGRKVGVEYFDMVLEDLNVTIVPVTVKHLKQLAEHPLYADHRDPMDRLIVAQAMADKVTLVSSDAKMERYRKCGLLFAFNKR